MTELARFEVSQHDDTCIVAISGEVDASNGDDVAKRLAGAFSNTVRRHIVDLSGIDYIDSVGLRTLFSLAERLRSRGGELHVVVPENSVIRPVLILADLPRLARLHDAVAAVP